MEQTRSGGHGSRGAPAHLIQSVGAHLTHKDPFQQLPADDDSRGSLSSSSAARQDPAGPGHHRQSTTSKRLSSISGFGPGSSSMKETASAKRTKPRNAKSAQEIIREAGPPSGISEIGIKLEGGDTPAPPTRLSQSPRSPQSSAPSPNPIDSRINNSAGPSHPNPRNHRHHLSTTTPLKFLKPAGVDEPPSDYVVPGNRDGERPRQQREADIADSATQRRQNIKRERDDRRGVSSGNGDGGGGGCALTSDRDRKRKKSGAAAAAAT